MRTTILLSKRNLLALLNKVDDPDSLKTIYKWTGGVNVKIVAEPDDLHYGEGEPGMMSAKTEKFIAGYEK